MAIHDDFISRGNSWNNCFFLVPILKKSLFEIQYIYENILLD